MQPTFLEFDASSFSSDSFLFDSKTFLDEIILDFLVGKTDINASRTCFANLRATFWSIIYWVVYLSMTFLRIYGVATPAIMSK